MSTGRNGDPPIPRGAKTLDQFCARLRELRLWAGLSYGEVHRLVVRRRQRSGIVELPAYTTVYRCFQAGRSRLDIELVTDIVEVLLGSPDSAAQWRQAYRSATGLVDEAAVVSVNTTLPDEPAGFVGRQDEIRLLTETCSGGGVVVLHGMAGVGKSTLAVYLAHRFRRDTGPELVFSIDLRGHDPDRQPAAPAAVLDTVLRKLGPPGSDVGRVDVAAQAAMFRRLMAGRRAVLLLDDAASGGQVRPLLPRSPTCLVLVTSRRRLPGLPEATQVHLDVFSPTDAMTLVRAGHGRPLSASERDAAMEIGCRVGYLPLALALVVGRIRAHAGWSMADHLDHLVEHQSRLQIGDTMTAALGMSYSTLAPESRRILRLLSLHPAREFDARQAAALAAVALPAARSLLADLVDSNLVRRRAADRYALHDLVHMFAAARARDEDSGSARRTALIRLLDHLREQAALAVDLFAPHERHRRPPVPRSAVPVLPLSARDDATAWLETERATLIAAALLAAEYGLAGYVGDLSRILYPFLDIAGYNDDAVVLHGRASEVSEPPVSGYAWNNLGCVHWRTGRLAEAVDCFTRAASVFAAAGEVAGRVLTVGNLGLVHQSMGHYPQALEQLGLAVELAREIGDRTGEGRITGNIGASHALVGRYAEAAEVLSRALDISREVGDRAGEGNVLGNLGICLEHLGDLSAAEQYYRDALDIAREVGHRDGMAGAMVCLGRVCVSRGRVPDGLRHLASALDITRADGNRQVEAEALNVLGRALLAVGSPADAAEQHRAAIAVSESVGDQAELARAHHGLAAALAATGEHSAAERHRRQARRWYRDLGMPEVAEVADALPGG